MPAGSVERTNARREEILNACEKLYATTNFKDITLKEIGKETTFTRSSIYNYFHTKEEIFLGLLKREYDLWISALNRAIRENTQMSDAEIADCIARTLSQRQLLRIIWICILSTALISIHQWKKPWKKCTFPILS